ncbi:hypothetical protein [Alteromonas sp. D210916BOD_24]|uniref:hypothetical protein n=1 Tax=Alteromonas sp. D210916BOD_24 TaxID=3157618 RepID=UPI00399CCECD
MKLRSVTLTASMLLLSTLCACSSVVDMIAQQAQVQPDEARIEFFAQRVESEKEYVQLMCRNHRLSDEFLLRDVEAGKHVLYVRARVINSNLDFQNVREAIVKFDVTLEGGKRYSLSQSREGDQMKIWLQESDTGLIASQIIDTTIEVPQMVGNLRVKQCREGTV